jgi:hypothetical protein
VHEHKLTPPHLKNFPASATGRSPIFQSCRRLRRASGDAWFRFMDFDGIDETKMVMDFSSIRTWPEHGRDCRSCTWAGHPLRLRRIARRSSRYVPVKKFNQSTNPEGKLLRHNLTTALHHAPGHLARWPHKQSLIKASNPSSKALRLEFRELTAGDSKGGNQARIAR